MGLLLNSVINIFFIRLTARNLAEECGHSVLEALIIQTPYLGQWTGWTEPLLGPINHLTFTLLNFFSVGIGNNNFYYWSRYSGRVDLMVTTAKTKSRDSSVSIVTG
jgi:hypothetical protein